MLGQDTKKDTETKYTIYNLQKDVIEHRPFSKFENYELLLKMDILAMISKVIKSETIPHPPTDSNCPHNAIESNMCEPYCIDCKEKVYDKDGNKLYFDCLSNSNWRTELKEVFDEVESFKSLHQRIEEYVENLIQSEREKVIGKHNAHILNEWQLQGFGDERVIFPILEKATKISLFLAFKGQRSREDYMRGYEESREKMIEEIEKLENYYRIEGIYDDLLKKEEVISIIKNKEE